MHFVICANDKVPVYTIIVRPTRQCANFWEGSYEALEASSELKSGDPLLRFSTSLLMPAKLALALI